MSVAVNIKKNKKRPARTQLVVMEGKKIAQDRKWFVILEDVMFSWLLFGFTSLDRSIRFVLSCEEQSDSDSAWGGY